MIKFNPIILMSLYMQMTIIYQKTETVRVNLKKIRPNYAIFCLKEALFKTQIKVNG